LPLESTGGEPISARARAFSRAVLIEKGEGAQMMEVMGVTVGVCVRVQVGVRVGVYVKV
jgi:hypothetical protein